MANEWEQLLKRAQEKLKEEGALMSLQVITKAGKFEYRIPTQPLPPVLDQGDIAEIKRKLHKTPLNIQYQNEDGEWVEVQYER